MKRLFVCALFAAMMAAAFAEPKNALLVANGNYTSFGSLNTPVKEAKELKKSLEKLGFAVTIVENAGREKILDSLLDFQRAVSASGGIAFFHYGGHAVQVAGKNYLIPVDADIPDERRVSSRAVDVDEVMASMQGETNIVILDACRNNPLPSSSGRSATRGLVMSEYKPANSIIVYSAQAGKVAQDGIFTPILTKKILEKKELGAVLPADSQRQSEFFWTDTVAARHSDGQPPQLRRYFSHILALSGVDSCKEGVGPLADNRLECTLGADDSGRPQQKEQPDCHNARH